MTVEELIELLEVENPAAEVRFAWQPTWPRESTLADRVVHLNDAQDPEGIVYLAEDEDIGSLPEKAAQELDWS